MAEPDILTMLAKIVYRHDTLLGSLAQGLLDTIRLVWPHVQKCGFEGCTEPATVRHVHLDILACDHHCARTMVRAGHNFVRADPDDGLNFVRGSLLREEDWVDVEDAESIRRLADYVRIMKDASQSPVIH